MTSFVRCYSICIYWHQQPKKNRTEKIFTTHETNIQGGNQITLNTGTLFSFHPVSLKAIVLRFEFRQFRIKQDTSVFHKTSLSHFRPIPCYNKYPIVSWDIALCNQICLTPTSYPVLLFLEWRRWMHWTGVLCPHSTQFVQHNSPPKLNLLSAKIFLAYFP